MANFKLVDYDHVRDGALCNGVVADLDGRPEAVWTYDLPGGSVTYAGPVAEAAFVRLWDGIDASLARRVVFWRFLVTDPTRPIDPEAGHVSVTTSERRRRERRHRHRGADPAHPRHHGPHRRHRADRVH